jgi:hypothetical protein
MQFPPTSACLFLLKLLYPPPRTRLSFLIRTTILPPSPSQAEDSGLSDRVASLLEMGKFKMLLLDGFVRDDV